MVDFLANVIDWYDVHIDSNEKIPKFVKTTIAWLMLLVLFIPICLVGTIVAGFCLLFSVLIGTISYDYARDKWHELCSYFAEL